MDTTLHDTTWNNWHMKLTGVAMVNQNFMDSETSARAALSRVAAKLNQTSQ